jgi:arginine-tRNA-protein transferase
VGTFSALWEIEYAREQGIPHYYLGYFVRACASMNYKARFRPNEVLRDYEHWTRPDGDGAA